MKNLKIIIIIVLIFFGILGLSYWLQQKRADEHRLFHWESQKEAALQYYIDRDTRVLMNSLNSLFYPPLNANYIAAANEIVKGFFPMYTYGVLDFRHGIDWSKKTRSDRSYLRYLHGQFFINDLMLAYKQSNNPQQKAQYILAAYRVIDDWIKKNPYQHPTDEMAWHDETTAQRLIVWIRFFDEARHKLSNKQLMPIMDSMNFQAQLLASDKFHKKNTNHGMYQDEALMVHSLYFNNLDNSPNYIALAKTRLIDYFNFIIGKDGVHKEHSPAYHANIAGFLQKYYLFFQQRHNVELSREFGMFYNRMAKYATFVIKPDGQWPMIGDTFFEQKQPLTLWPDDPHYQYAISAGKIGSPSPETDAVFPEGGYAIFRDSWDKKSVGTYIHFTAAFHTRYHKHADDLSIWLYANGDILAEAGPNGYNYRQPLTQYGYSSFAHNTLIVDDKGNPWPIKDKQFDTVYIQNYKITPEIATVTGVNKRYPGITHTRTLSYNKAKQIMLVQDHIASQIQHDYKLLWHFAPGLVPKIEGRKVIITKGQKEVLEIDIASAKPIKIQQFYGEKDPLYKSVQIHIRNEAILTYMIAVEAKGDTANIISTFHIK